MIFQQLWDDFPLLNYVIYATVIACIEILSLVPPQLDYVWSFIFPLTVPAIVYALRWKNTNYFNRWLYAVILMFAPLMIGLCLAIGIRIPIDSQDIQQAYEIVAIVNLLVLLIHAARLHPKLVWILLGPITFYGLLLENGGILLGFYTELNYSFYLGSLPAPLATLSGWISIFYLVIWVNWEVQKHIQKKINNTYLMALLAAFSGLMLDLQLDPFASFVGFWNWNPILQQKFLGVPILNFVAWSSAIYSFAWVFFSHNQFASLKYQTALKNSHIYWLFYRIPLILIIATIVFSLSMIFIEKGVNGPTFTIIKASISNFTLFRPIIFENAGFVTFY